VCTFDLVIEAVEVSGYGRPASEALAAAVARAKDMGPLSAVTVVVPSNFVGLSARRLLGSGALGVGATSGIANVSFVTPFRLAELVAADLLLDKAPITNPVLGAAVRQVLAEDADIYRPVADHEATEAALAALFAEMSNVDEAGLESIEDEGSRAALLAVKFYRRIAARLDGFHTEHDLATAAAERADLDDRLQPFGHVIWYLPAPVTPAVGRFIGEALRRAESSTVIVGLTGIEKADIPVWLALEGASVEHVRRTLDPVPTGDEIVSVTDAPEEVREVCQRIIGLVSKGVRLDRIGVFFPAPDPYVRIIEQQFAAAEVPVNGPDPRRLADSVAGRTLLGALGLAEARWRRDRVIAVVSGGPLRFEDDNVRPAVWDDLSREAGVVMDLADWRSKIEYDAKRTEVRIEQVLEDELTDSGAYRLQRLRDRLDDGQNLVKFVEQLQQRVLAVEKAEGWPEKCTAATALLHALLGTENQHSSWPEHDQEAFGRVEDALIRLASLDQIEPSPTHAVFQRALRTELDVARGRHGRFGHGVVYGPIGSAVGHDLDAVFILGATEGLLPVPRRDDAILPEAVRLNSLDQLESKGARLDHQHRAYLAVLAAAPAGRRMITFPRGDLRSSRTTLPSRWLLDTASHLAGKKVHATDFSKLGAEVVTLVDSFAAGVRRSDVAASVDQRDLAALGKVTDAGGSAVDHELAGLVGKGLATQQARGSGDFTEFDGNLESLVGADQFPLPAIGDRALSPSRLESWAGCGFKYFLTYVLEVADRDDPERTDELSALDRGSLIHRTLERFIGEAIEVAPPGPDEPWPASARARLREIADEECVAYEQSGRTGRRVNWWVQRDDLHDLLDAFIAADDEFRRSHRATPHRVELDLGVKSGHVVPVTLPNGQSISLRGMVDRVDITEDGRVLVNDYKSGKAEKYDKLDEDPFLAGDTLQLGMYAEGAIQETGRQSAAAQYWRVERFGEDQWVGYAWTPELRDRFHEVLTAITSGIGQGVFAAQPGEWNTWRQTNENCGYCDFDSVCVRDRGDHELAKAEAPALAVRVGLSPTPPEAEPGPASASASESDGGS
jgi:ATP-dependent helicase/nuclease subunit B